MTLFEVDDTLTVAQVNKRIADALKRAFRGEVWVQGQIRNLNRSARGHVYFDLIEPVPAGAAPKASIPVTLFDSNRQIVNRVITRTGNSVRIDDGVEVRIRGAIEVYAPRGQVQLNMSSIDPEFTLGRLGADREQLLRDLRGDGLIDANRARPMPLVPLRVALVTSDGSAAHADFTRQIATSGYAFSVTTINTRVQGEFAPDEIAAAIARAQQLPIDVIAIVRGGGARTDLAAFDTEPVARAIVDCTVPVLCGIGHEIDEAVADLVAHASFKTPTACAQHLVERVVAFDFELAERASQLRQRALVGPVLASARVADIAEQVAARARGGVDEAERQTTSAAAGLERLVTARIERSQHRLTDRATRLRFGANQAVAAATARADAAAQRLADRARLATRDSVQRLDLAQARVDAVDPVQAMRRGWSITTDATGRAVRSVDAVETGGVLTTRLADGSITSTVSSTSPTSASPTSSTTPQRPEDQ